MSVKAGVLLEEGDMLNAAASAAVALRTTPFAVWASATTETSVALLVQLSPDGGTTWATAATLAVTSVMQEFALVTGRATHMRLKAGEAITALEAWMVL